MIAGSPLFESIYESIPLGKIALLHSEHPTSRSNAETLREVHGLAQCPLTGRHNPAYVFLGKGALCYGQPPGSVDRLCRTTGNRVSENRI
jgi:hypothetical protein